MDLTQPSITVDRENANDVVLSDDRVSGYHAEMHCEDGKVFIMELGSTNGNVCEREENRRSKSSTRLVASQEAVGASTSDIGRKTGRNGLIWGLGGAIVAVVAAVGIYFASQPSRLVALHSGGRSSETVSKSIPKQGDTFINSLGMKFVYIAPGTFIMESPLSEATRDSDEVPHRVTLSRGFWLQTTEVTQTQWQGLMMNNSSISRGSDHSVDSASWFDAVTFAEKLGQREGKAYRLPTEAEWEYTARAGSSGKFCFGDNPSGMEEYAWHYSSNSDWKTHRVGQKKSNAWGLADMYGNV